MMNKLRGRNLAHPGCFIGTTIGLTLGIVLAGILAAVYNVALNTVLLTWLGLTVGLGIIGWILGTAFLQDFLRWKRNHNLRTSRQFRQHPSTLLENML